MGSVVKSIFVGSPAVPGRSSIGGSTAEAPTTQGSSAARTPARKRRLRLNLTVGIMDKRGSKLEMSTIGGRPTAGGEANRSAPLLGRTAANAFQYGTHRHDRSNFNDQSV